MPKWTDADQALAKAVQKEIGAEKIDGLKTAIEPLSAPKEVRGGGSDDVGDISWNVPMVYMFYPANIPHTPGHSWVDAIAMATPIAHKGSTAGAKVQAMTALDLLLEPELVKQAWDYFRNVQTKDIHYQPLIEATDQPAVELNRAKMESLCPSCGSTTTTRRSGKTYLEQLGIQYPTIRSSGGTR